MMPTATAPIAGHHIQWMGSRSNASSIANSVRVMMTAARPITNPSPTYAAMSRPLGGATVGIANIGVQPMNAARMPVAVTAASDTGMMALGLYSNSSSSTA